MQKSPRKDKKPCISDVNILKKIQIHKNKARTKRREVKRLPSIVSFISLQVMAGISKSNNWSLTT